MTQANPKLTCSSIRILFAALALAAYGCGGGHGLVCGEAPLAPPKNGEQARTVGKAPVASSSASAASVSSAASAEAPRAKLAKELNAIFDTPEYASALWGVRVETLDGHVVYDRNGAKGFAPASNLKIYTTAAACDLLGPDFRYETRLDAVGAISPQGILEGNLVLVGSGDPCFGAWHGPAQNDNGALLGEWAAKVKQAGIREIKGDIIGDGRVFTPEYYNSNWEIDDILYWYATGTSGLCVEENCFRFTTAPGKKLGDPCAITLKPASASVCVTVVNDTVTTVAGGPKTADIVWRGTDSMTVRFAGTCPIDAEPFEQRGSVWDGARYTAVLFREALRKEGIEVHGEARNIRSLADLSALDHAAPRKALAAFQSPTVREILKIVNKPSHNFFADHLLRTLGYKFKGEGSYSAGAKVVQEWMAKNSVPQTDVFIMLDGSGLARRNSVQPRQTCAVLRYMYNKESVRDPFFDSISIAGVDGDLKGRMKDAPLKGNLRAKTGYIGQVRSLSGYVKDADGQMLVFSIIVNHDPFGYGHADKLIFSACEFLGKFSEKTSAAQ